MRTLVCIHSGIQQTGLPLLLDGIKSYRDAESLDWDVRLVVEADREPLPETTWWVIPTPGTGRTLPTTAARDRTITLAGFWNESGHHYCKFDHARCGELAALHLHEQGYTDAATVRLAQRSRFFQRYLGFSRTSKKLGMRVHAFQCGGLDSNRLDQHLLSQIRAFSRIGIYSPNDAQAHWLRNQFLRAGIALPDQVGLIGTGNADVPCLAREPCLSSVVFPWIQIGRETARAIHHLEEGRSPSSPVTIRPQRVEQRASTTRPPPDDPLVLRAVIWMRSHLNCPDPLAAACQACGVSPNTLCRRFKQDLGVSPGRFMDILRLERCGHLLIHTRLPSGEVAKLSGYRSSSYMGVCFKRHKGCTPTEYREG